MRRPRPPGSRVWFTGHWGLQQYLEAAGARGLDLSRGGWDEVASGDFVVVPFHNSSVLMPRSRLRGRTEELLADTRVPLRLIGGGAGFYSSVFGFLPYALSREPLDRLRLSEKY